MSATDTSRLKRPVHPVPAFVRAALRARKLTKVFHARPAFQQNDYIGWITAAKLPATQHKRLEQMLDELARGDTYMKMHWRMKPRARSK